MITSFRARHIPVLFGPGAALRTGLSVKERGVKKVLCLYDEGIQKAGIAEKIVRNLTSAGVEVVEFDKVTVDTPDQMVNEAAALGRAQKVGGVVGVGGGSTLDAAKAVNLLMTNDPPINQYIGMMRPSKPGLPLFLLPTTAGTGSEVTSVAVITDTATNIKKGVVGPATEATLAIVDPELTLGLPSGTTASTGMDAFSHAAEAFTSARRNPISDVLAEKAISLILANLPVAVKDGSNPDARYHMSFAALIAGAAFSDAVVHLGHSMAHTLGAAFHIPHGIGCTVALPVILEYVADVVPEKVRQLGLIMGLEMPEDLPAAELGARVAEAIRRFGRSVGVPGLAEVTGRGIPDEETLARMADIVLADSCTTMAPKTPSKAEVVSLLRAAYQY